MRTTVELPPALLPKAKMRAAARGESLRTLLTRAVAAELGQGNETTTRRRVELPLFGDPTGPPVDLSGLDLAGALAGDDAARAIDDAHTAVQAATTVIDPPRVDYP